MKKGVLTFVLLLLAATFAPAAGPFFINELLFNPPGIDTPNEYVEIRANPTFAPVPSALPANVYLIGIEGDAQINWGQLQTIFDLSNIPTGTNGYLVIRQAGNSYTVNPNANVLTGTTTGFGGLSIFSASPAGTTDIENATATYMLVQSTTPPTLLDDIDSNNDGTPDGALYAGFFIYDAVGVLDGASIDAVFGQFNITDGANGLSNVGVRETDTIAAGYIARRGDTVGSNGADWVASEGLNGNAPNWRLPLAANTFPDAWEGGALNHLGGTNVFALSAAAVTVAGRVLTQDGRGIAKAIVSISDQSGNFRTAMTNPFGYYTFEGVAAGQSYTLQVKSKSYQFAPQIISIGDDISDLDFIAQ